MELSIQRHTPINSNANINYSSPSSSNAMAEEVALAKPTSPNKPEGGNNNYQGEEQSHRELTKDETLQLTKQLNEFMKRMDANLEFEIHEETERLMVKFVDKKEQRVIKEFPPRELLDTLAAIREYVGILLDKRV